MIILSIGFVITSCHFTEQYNQKDTRVQEIYDSLIARAGRMADTLPDQAIALTDSAIKQSSGYRLKPGTAYKAYRIKANLFVNQGNIDTALAILEDARLLLLQQTDTLSLALTEKRLGLLCFDFGNYLRAEKHLQSAIAIFQKLKHDEHLAESRVIYGQLLTETGAFAKSQEYLMQVYQYLQRVNQPERLYSLCIDIGNNHAEMNRFNDALYYYRIAERGPYRSENDPTRISALINIGILYRSKDPDSALYYYDLAMRAGLENINPIDVIRLKLNKANLFLVSHELDSALKMYQEVLDYCSQNLIYPGMIRALNGISGVYDLSGDLSQAIHFEKMALSLADSTEDHKLAIILMEELAELYKKSGNITQCVGFLRKAKAMSDSLHNADKTSASRELEIINTINKKDIEYDRVTHELKQEKFRKRFNLILLIVFVITSLVLTFFLTRIYRLYKERRNAYKVLMQNYLVERSRIVGSSLETTTLTEKLSASDESPDPLLQALIDYYQIEKPYLDPQLRVETVMERLACTHRSLIQALKNHKYPSFSSFTNYYRVEEAIRMMEDPKYKNYKIEAIATESGFGTRMSFYNAFEKQTGIKPSFFRNTLLQKMAS